MYRRTGDTGCPAPYVGTLAEGRDARRHALEVLLDGVEELPRSRREHRPLAGTRRRGADEHGAVQVAHAIARQAGRARGEAYFRSLQFDVAQSRRLEPLRTFSEVQPAELFDFVLQTMPRGAQAVFIGGNGLRAAGAIEALEVRLAVPVIAANQVLLWEGLRRIGQAERVRGYGRLFQA